MIPTNEITKFTINNCSQSQEKEIEFGEGTVITTNQCTFQHQYSQAGLYQLRVSIEKHHSCIRLLYVQDKVQGLQFLGSSIATVVHEEFFVNWTIVQGTLTNIAFNFQDGSSVYKFNIGKISSTYRKRNGHNYTMAGAYNITVTAFNHVSSAIFSTMAIVEERINVSDVSVAYLGIFDRYYQLDEMTVTVRVHAGSNPHYRYHMGNGVIVSNQSPFLKYIYQQPGTYNLTVEVYNNASSVNITKVIAVEPVIPINNDAAIIVANTAFLTSTLVNVSLTIANPYECNYDFGDGESARVLSHQNLTNLTHVFANTGKYAITVTCKNALSSKVLKADVIVQRAITGLNFVNDGPKEMNETVTHKVTATDLGTDSCYFIDLGDGSSKGFGKRHCQQKYTSTTFRELKNETYIIQNMYFEVKLFFDSVHAWNLVSEFKIQNRLPILKMSCNYPNTSIVGLSKDVTHPTKITRLILMPLETSTTVNCRATKIRDYLWTFFTISKDKTQIGPLHNLGTLVTASIMPKTYDYGLYLLRFNVSMRGQEGIWTVADTFIDIVPNDLISKIEGGQIIERAYDTKVSFTGDKSYDPDYAGTSDLGYYWFITNNTDQEELDIHTATHGKPIEESHPLNVDELCDMSSPRRLYKAGSKIEVFTSKLKVNETYVIFLVVTRKVFGISRWKATFQVMKVVEGDPPVVGVRCVVEQNITIYIKLRITKLSDNVNRSVLEKSPVSRSSCCCNICHLAHFIQT